MDSPQLAYAHLLGLGFLWINIHCAGMCGPLLGGLACACTKTTPDSSASQQLLEGTRSILSYQLGRALIYALLGALAGWVGAALEGVVQGVSSIAGLVMAVCMVLIGLLQIDAIKRALHRLGVEQDSWFGSIGGRIGRLLQRLSRVTGGTRSMFSMGIIMSMLPCMIMIWVLGLAASTASPLHGAGVMVGLVVMTTPVLLFSAWGALMGRRKTRASRESVAPYLMTLSGIWMGLIACAANGWIDHIHIPFEIGSKTYVMMLW